MSIDKNDVQQPKAAADLSRRNILLAGTTLAASALGASAQAIADARQLRLDALEKQLRGELEWIPLMAMRKDRARRYASASQLADDIRNYLSGRPLAAGPESAAYRLHKFLSRNRAPVNTASCNARTAPSTPSHSIRIAVSLVEGLGPGYRNSVSSTARSRSRMSITSTRTAAGRAWFRA